VAAAFAIAFLLTWLMIHLAPRIGLVDHPSERKVHTRTTPRGGGVAIFLWAGCPSADWRS
jgi:UDP-GlcNAc:undecaprenyl-phosphate GlcNAc-1-phosphate transferase